MPKRIVWALDASANGAALNQKTAQLLQVWARQSWASIEPVMVLSPKQLRTVVNFAGRSEDVLEQVTKELKIRIEKLSMRGMLPPRVLISPDFTLRNAVSVLTGYAKQSDAVLIVATSRAPKSVRHVLLGSFAETLVMQSDISVFLVTRRMGDWTKIRNIFFPTDLSAVSRETLNDVLPFARELGAKLYLFHKIEHAPNWTMNAYHAKRLYAARIECDVESKKRELRDWTQAIGACGVDATHEVDESPGRSVAQALLTRVDADKASIIAMASNTGPVASAMPGWTTRKVMRGGSCPLWIVRRRVHRHCEL